ncbi:MAG: Eco57I restriction-modification methylase domain-containing protein [bacterium]
MNDTAIPAEQIHSVNSLKDLVGFISGLGYDTKLQSIYIPDLGLPESAQNLMQESFLLADYDRNFQIYFIRPSSMRRTDFRTVLEPFYRRYPQGNYLFVFTTDWEEIAFVSPERVAIEPGKTKLRFRILFVDRSNVYHTDLEVLNSIAILPTEQRAELIWQKHLEAFNVERVTKEFFEAYKSALNFIKGELLSQNKAPYQKVHSFAQQLLSRIMFLYFVQKKGWLKWKDYIQDKRYIKNLWEKYKKYAKKRDSFYSDWLCCLFFYALNGPGRHAYIRDFNIPDGIKESFIIMPFLNGGLFAENELDKIGFEVPDKVFELLFEMDPLNKKRGFLERYNFTIREDTPLDVEVAVDPEMLGKVYESLISEEERGKAGIFYTPRIEIDYMCRLSLTEYLHDTTGIPKQALIQFVFEPSEDSNLPGDQLRKVESALDKVRIVDPAVGSASFLVGMMNVLTELHRCINKRFDREVNEFDLKSQVIRENLYGVDVKDWAVMVGELRLWLSLIIETEEKELIERTASIYQHPLLPNLTFKMRQGDSLVEEIAGVPLSLRGKFKHIPEKAKGRITGLIDKKASYFGSRSADLSEKERIEALENELFSDIIGDETQRLEREIEKLEEQIRRPAEQMELIKITPEQEDLFKEEVRRIKGKTQELELERTKLHQVLKDIGGRRTKDYFLWEIDFAEIFNEKGGFDIVIGNPPYVRQEKVAPPLEREEDHDAETWRAKKREYKERLERSVKMQWGDFIRIDKKSDLYVYFYYHGLALLRPGGVFCFINSNSWLDVGYGAPLQEFLLKNLEPLYVIDNQAKRSFKESDVNTVIVAIKRPEKPGDNTIRFVTYKKPFDELLSPDNLIEIEQSSKVNSTEDYRVFPITRKELLKDGVNTAEKETLLKEPEHLPYIGSKWGGKYLRAPDIFFKILGKAKRYKCLIYGDEPIIVEDITDSIKE